MTASLKENLSPTISLVLITLVVTIILVLTHGATAPVIEKLNKEAADQARTEVLAAANSFTQQSIPAGTEGVLEYYTADNGAGAVITTVDKGFGGKIETMVGIDASGKITGLKILNHKETPGLGTQAMTPKYLSQYTGAQSIKTNKLNQDRTDAVTIDTITGATISSNAIYRAIDNALAFHAENGGHIDEA